MAGETAAVKQALPKREVKIHTLTCKTDQAVKQVPVTLRDLVIFLLVVRAIRKVTTAQGLIIISIMCVELLLTTQNN
jgi:hypothetical protein